MTSAPGSLIMSIRLSGVPESAGTAREFIRDVLGEDHPSVDVAMLLTSELVSNSLQHSRSGQRDGGRLTVTVAMSGDLIRVEVIDEGSDGGLPPIPPQVDELSESGRGLWLVQELSSAWGWTDGPAERVVWFHAPGR